METIYINLIGSSQRIPFTMTYGIHRELQSYLLTDNKLFSIFTDTTVSDEIIKLCLSKRNDMGQITNEFMEIQDVKAEDMVKLLNVVFDYFSDFFLKHNQKIQSLTNNLHQISQP